MIFSISWAISCSQKHETIKNSDNKTCLRRNALSECITPELVTWVVELLGPDLTSNFQDTVVIPYKEVADFVASCPNCIKTRLGMKEALVPVMRDLKSPRAYSAIGIYAVKITPPGRDGHTHINVVVNLFTKKVFLDKVKGVTALSLANTVWAYWGMFGHTNLVI